MNETLNKFKIINIYPENENNLITLKIYYGEPTGAKIMKYINVELMYILTEVQYNELSALAFKKMIPKTLDKDFNEFNIERLIRQTKSLLENHPEYLI